MTKTFSLKPAQIKRQWYMLDASAASVGRLATIAARLLSGKHRPTYTPHIDGGDGVIIVNAAKLKLTGRKLDQKQYYRHSGHPGALKQLTAKQQLAKDPTVIIERAVKGMLAKNKLQANRLARLRIFKDDQHGMEAQKPIVMEVK